MSHNKNASKFVNDYLNCSQNSTYPSVIPKENGNKFRLLDLNSLQESVAHLDSLKKVSKGFDSDLPLPTPTQHPMPAAVPFFALQVVPILSVLDKFSHLHLYFP